MSEVKKDQPTEAENTQASHEKDGGDQQATASATGAADVEMPQDARGFIPPGFSLGSVIAEAMSGIVRTSLEQIKAAQTRSPESSDFTQSRDDGNVLGITFRIDRTDVILPPLLREQLNKTRSKIMTLVLDLFFHSIEIESQHFSVVVRFETVNGKPYWHRVVVPYSSVTQISHKDSYLDMVPWLPDGVKETGESTSNYKKSRRQIRRAVHSANSRKR